MDRKEWLKTVMLGALSLPLFGRTRRSAPPPSRVNEPWSSEWSRWPNVSWAGPQCWANRLQDWRVAGGGLECTYSGANRTVHCLTRCLTDRPADFRVGVTLEVLKQDSDRGRYAGFRVGARAGDDPAPVTFSDSRRDAVFGVGLDAGLTADGRLFIGAAVGSRSLPTQAPVRLELDARSEGRSYRLVLTATDVDGNEMDGLVAEDVSPGLLEGNLALVSHFPSDDAPTPSARFTDWRLSGGKVAAHPGRMYGPICFAQYTLDRGRLKLTAQFAPVEQISGHEVMLQVQPGPGWETIGRTTVDPLSRTAHFRVDEWAHRRAVPYRVLLKLPLTDRTDEYTYEGTIAAEPRSSEHIRLAAFSCNRNFGFPNQEVVENVARHRPDLAVFLGDQIYEGHHGFGVERSDNVQAATLDYLAKWYMFGWSYRDVFRHIPSVFIPDDHDVYHGNIWGEGGKEAPTDQGYGYPSQDRGGYHMPAEWVRMVERTQTSHLPDPVDPEPVEQEIGVYFTNWTYGGISFAILEDRKFKSAPDTVLPIDVVNGFPQDPDVDLTRFYDVDADLLGARQEAFLEEWVRDWSGGAEMKVVLSQSPFCGAHTMGRGATHDRGVPQRPIPMRGEYPQGDVPAPDMDSNGWPQRARDRALRIIRKAFALHVAGDQHLASVVHYGTDAHEDAGLAFTLPALNNTWPRRWWPNVGSDHRPLPGRPPYTGRFSDAFGNRMTVVAVANPVQTNKRPAIIYDRAPGYGIIVFDKVRRTIRCECWPRDVDPDAHPAGQFDGWPLEVGQMDNYPRTAAGRLSDIRVTGLAHPVVMLFNESTGDLEYALRIRGDRFRPHVFDTQASYRLRVGDPDTGRWQEVEALTITGPADAVPIRFD